MIVIEEGNILDDKYTMICHQVNTLGIMGAGLAKQIKDKYSEVYEEYYKLCKNNSSEKLYNLGADPVVTNSTPEKIIWNIFAQNRIDGPLPRTNYKALETGFKRILYYKYNEWFNNHKLAIPYGIGCGLAGGNWDGVVYPMIQNIFRTTPLDVVIVKYRKEN